MNTAAQTVLADPSILNGAVFCVSAVIGQILHSVKQWANGDADTFLGWLTSNPKRTVAAVIGNAGALLTALTVVGIDNMTLTQIIATGGLLGLSADSIINRGVRPTWSNEGRAAK